MLTFICLFCPAVLCLRIYQGLCKKNLTAKECFLRMGTNILFINFGCIAIKKFLLRTAGSPLYSGNDMLPSVAFNYMILAIFVAVVLAVFEVLFSKNISFEVTEEKKN